jgi:hypothetical protein
MDRPSISSATSARPASAGRASARARATFQNPLYQRHNQRRQEHLASLALPLHRKSVLELGPGIGDHTLFFLDRDCTVVSVEPRAENCQLFAERMRALLNAGYRKAANSKIVKGDIETLDRTITGRFDIIYCYGVLYHLDDPEAGLRTMAAHCGDLLLLETCVSFGAHEAINRLSEAEEVPIHAVHGIGCRPTRPWVFNRLKELFAHVYVPRTQPPDEKTFPLDWTSAEHGSMTRAIFIAARQPLANPLLLDYLPDRQRPC